jgi:hypothetical protein
MAAGAGGRVDELTINAQRRIGWILLCLPFVVSLGTSAVRSTCGSARVTDVNVAGVYRESFEGRCTRVSVAGVRRTWSTGCAQPRPAPETCVADDADPMPSARWVLGVIAAISVMGGLWRRSLASVTVDHGARTVRVETEGGVSVVGFTDRPAVVKDKKRFVVQAASHEPISLGKAPDPRDIDVLRDCLASLS